MGEFDIVPLEVGEDIRGDLLAIRDEYFPYAQDDAIDTLIASGGVDILRMFAGEGPEGNRKAWSMLTEYLADDQTMTIREDLARIMRL